MKLSWKKSIWVLKYSSISNRNYRLGFQRLSIKCLSPFSTICLNSLNAAIPISGVQQNVRMTIVCVVFLFDKNNKFFKRTEVIHKSDFFSCPKAMRNKKNVSWFFHPFWGYSRFFLLIFQIVQNKVQNSQSNFKSLEFIFYLIFIQARGLTVVIPIGL